MIWLKIILPALLALGIIAGVGWHFKNYRNLQTELATAKGRIVQLEANLAARNGEVADLNARIRWRNEQAQAEVDRAEAAQAKAKLEADKARADKERSDVRLAEAQRKYREILNANENVRTYSTTVIPDAVLDRLRSANGEAESDTVRTGPDTPADLQATSSRLVAWLHLPYSAAERVDK